MQWPIFACQITHCLAWLGPGASLREATGVAVQGQRATGLLCERGWSCLPWLGWRALSIRHFIRGNLFNSGQCMQTSQAQFSCSHPMPPPTILPYKRAEGVTELTVCRICTVTAVLELKTSTWMMPRFLPGGSQSFALHFWPPWALGRIKYWISSKWRIIIL